MMDAIGRWWFEPLPVARIAWLRSFFYSFIFVDVLLTTSWVARHGAVSTDLYDPLLVGRALSLPHPTRTVVVATGVLLLGAAGIAATNRLPRLAGSVVAAAYFVWMVIAFSYGKVDHDRFAFLVALCVLPTVGRAHWSDREETEAAGWAIRSIQVAVVLAYFLAAFAKFRFGGLNWATGATLARALVRKGNWISQQLFEMPGVLRATQFGIIAFELLSPLLLVRGRVGYAFLILALLFHAVTFLTISIVFLPHVVCLLAFLPLERLSRTPALSPRRASLGDRLPAR
jgi:hypothetical protein